MKTNRLLTMVCIGALVTGALQAPLVCAEDAEQTAAETKTQISQDTLYTITYIKDGGVGRIDNTEPVTKSTKVTVSPWALRKDGYSHYAWTDGEHTYRRGETISMPAHDVELRPVWRRTFKVTYEKLEDYGYATPFQDGSVAPGTQIYLPNIPMHKGDAIFNGWYVNGEYHEALSTITIGEEDTHVSVCWLDPVEIDYFAGDVEGVIGSPHYIVQAYPGFSRDIAGTDRISRLGYKLDGFTDPNDNDRKYDFKDSFMVTEEGKTFVAVWVPIKVGMKFRGGEGAEGKMPNQIAEFDSWTKLNECTYTKEGYKLLGWKHGDDYYLPETEVKVKVAEYGDFMEFDAVWIEEERNPGDVNGDGIIDLMDLTTLSMHVVGDSEIKDEKALDDADVQRDGKVDIADLARLRQFLMQDKILLGV